MGWLNTDVVAGDPSLTKSEPRIGGGPFRFFIGKGETKSVIFLTSGDRGSCPELHEHQLWLNRKPVNMSCYNDDDGKEKCPMCIAALDLPYKYRAKKVQLYSILDLTKFRDRQGVEHTHSVKLLVAPPHIAEYFGALYQRHKEKGKTLRYAKYTVKRGASDKTPNVGDQWFYEEHVDPATIPKDVQEINYEEALAPNLDGLKMLAEKFLKEAKYVEENLPDGLKDKPIEY